MFPVEIAEKIAWFLPPKDFYAFAKTDSSVMAKFDQTDNWVVEFPPIISWADTKNSYVPYDKANFTIRYKGKEYKREDGFSFRQDRNRLIRADGNLELLVEKLLLENPTTRQKGVCIGKAPQTDEQFIISSLQKWRTASKPVAKTHLQSADSILKCAREEREMWSLMEREMDGMFRN
jgi:hypothetical protein